MKGKKTITKAHSPTRIESSSEEDIIDEDEKNHIKIPDEFTTNNVSNRVIRLSNNRQKGPIERKARSNSPRQGLARKDIKDREKINRSPIPRKESPLTHLHTKISNTTKTSTSNSRQSPLRTKTKISPERTKNRVSPGRNQLIKKSSSPHPATAHALESKETSALRMLAKKKRQLNKELWEASENGNLLKITQLLEP